MLATTPPNMHALQGLTLDDQLLFAKFGQGEIQRPQFSCVHHAFEHHAKTQPSATAVEHLGSSITYGELDQLSNCLATDLRILGVGPGSRVLLLVQRSIPMVVGILAILKAGGQYVPLDGGIVTDSTLAFVLDDSRATVVLALQDYAHRVVTGPNRHLVILEDAIAKYEHHVGPCSKLSDLASTDDGVYVIYTSGTTGKPKGVDVMHRNVVNLVCLSPGNVGMKPGMRVAQLLNVAFDMCAWEVLGSLSNGCTLCIRGKRSKDWRAVMKTVDIIISTPSILGPHDPADYPNVKYVATAGELCPQSLADAWSRNAQFFNSCGPTEITIVNTVQPHIPGDSLSIGKPTPNNNVYILDEDMNPLPIGEKGVMWAGGAGITRGYVNLPQKTDERYKRDPFLNDGSIMFNTGDLGRWRPDGQIDHLGRVDDQVKVKGFRVELDGVATAMETTPGVKVACALLIEGTLWGFYSPEKIDVEEIRTATALIQPYYAVPTRYFPLPDFPHTNNGKIDKRALRQMAADLDRFSEKQILEASLKINVDAKALQDNGQVIAVQPTRVSVDAIVWSDVGVLSAPPPVYRKDSHGTVVESPTSDTSSDSQTLASSSNSVNEKAENEVPAAEVSVVEKGHNWEGYEEEDLPDKTQMKFVRNIRHQIFSLYRRLFGVVFVTNMAIFIASLAKGGLNAQQLGQIVVANLFCAILMRQDYVINAFFNVFCAVPVSWPLSIRRVCARVYHIGGLHSGCAISGVVWLIYFVGQATSEFVHGGRTSLPTLIVSYWILFLLIGIVTFAYPRVRSVAHDKFERTHRFLGWTATFFVWAQVILLTNDYRQAGQSLGQALVHAPPFWLVVALTMSIILPWTRLRKVPVRSVVLSTHAVRLYFDYVTPVPGTFTRVSKSPLMEWHGFATVPEPGMKGYSLVVSRAGDWTSEHIENPPTHLWVRGIPTCGVLRIVPLFKRLVFVATGSGIGPCAPCILEKRVPIRLLWTSPNVRKTFGDQLVDSIMEASPDAVIYDTRTHGKPDMVKLTYKLVREFNAEAVCVISNQKLTRKVVYGMMSRGIPAFGAIWDS